MGAITVTATIKGISPYSQNGYYKTPKLDRESAADYEARTWRDRMTVDKDGYVIIPPMALKNCLSDAARFLSVKIAGKRNATFTKHFEAGVIVTDPIRLPIKKGDVPFEWLFVPADGKRGGSSRVEKCFGIIHEWGGTAVFHVLDHTITETAFREHLEQAGSFIGLGRFRPRNNGFYGRFVVESLRWDDPEKA